MKRAGEDYLEAVLRIETEQEREGVRITDIAKLLSVTKPSVISAIKTLSKDGYISQESYSEIYLTEKGRIKAEQVYRRHKTLKEFFFNVLGVDEEIAEKDACKIEHDISSDSMEKIASFVEAYLKK